MTAERPDYVTEFAKTKPVHTQIKCIHNHYYLYECYTRYDRNTKKPVKISGRMIGTITEHGLVECTRRKPRRKDEPTEFEKYMQQAGLPRPGQTDGAMRRETDSAPGEKDAEAVTVRTSARPAAGMPGETEDRRAEQALPGAGKPPSPPEGTDMSGKREIHGQPAVSGIVSAQRKEQAQEKEPVSGNFPAQRARLTAENFTLAANCFIPPVRSCKHVEIGTGLYLCTHTKDIRDRLLRHFPEGNFGLILYVIAAVRTIYDAGLGETEEFYLQSILSHVYPGIPLDPESISRALDVLGCSREAIEKYMKETLPERGRFALVSSRPLLSADPDRPDREDSRQILLLYLYQLLPAPEGTGFQALPAYYKRYPGNPADIEAAEDLLRETDHREDDVTLVADGRGISEADIAGYEKAGLRYVAVLNRDSPYAREPFSFGNSTVFMQTCHGEKAEHSTTSLAGRQTDMTKKTGLSQYGTAGTELSQAEPVLLLTNHPNEEAGTVAACYRAFESSKEDWNTFGNFLDFCGSDGPDAASLEGWLFLNHISSGMTSRVLQNIREKGKIQDASFQEVRAVLRTIVADRAGNSWSVNPVSEEASRLCSRLQFQPEEVLQSFDWNYLDKIKRNKSK